MAAFVGRREFVTLLGGAAAVWPIAVCAQQPRRVGVLIASHSQTDREGQASIAAFLDTFQRLGWTDGRNVRIEYRWGAGDSKLYRKYAPELVALTPDVIVVVGGTAVGELQRVTHTIPIIFVGTTDPVNRGLIASMARPGGNTTGSIEYEFGMSGKWLELLKQIVPSVSRVMVVRDPSFRRWRHRLVWRQPRSMHGNGKEIEHTVTTFARGSNVGLIVTLSGSAIGHRKLMITLAARHRLPAVPVDDARQLPAADRGLGYRVVGIPEERQLVDVGRRQDVPPIRPGVVTPSGSTPSTRRGVRSRVRAASIWTCRASTAARASG